MLEVCVAQHDVRLLCVQGHFMCCEHEVPTCPEHQNSPCPGPLAAEPSKPEARHAGASEDETNP
jgi:hypothetical protein